LDEEEGDVDQIEEEYDYQKHEITKLLNNKGV
jgi:hypothetical protein